MRAHRPLGSLVIAIDGVTKLYKMGEETIHALPVSRWRSGATNTSRSWGRRAPASPRS
jgi:hypothetical protein